MKIDAIIIADQLLCIETMLHGYLVSAEPGDDFTIFNTTLESLLFIEIWTHFKQKREKTLAYHP